MYAVENVFLFKRGSLFSSHEAGKDKDTKDNNSTLPMETATLFLELGWEQFFCAHHAHVIFNEEKDVKRNGENREEGVDMGDVTLVFCPHLLLPVRPFGPLS